MLDTFACKPTVTAICDSYTQLSVRTCYRIQLPSQLYTACANTANIRSNVHIPEYQAQDHVHVVLLAYPPCLQPDVCAS
jgi:hypothetical protein